MAIHAENLHEIPHISGLSANSHLIEHITVSYSARSAESVDYQD